MVMKQNENMSKMVIFHSYVSLPEGNGKSGLPQLLLAPLLRGQIFHRLSVLGAT